MTIAIFYLRRTVADEEDEEEDGDPASGSAIFVSTAWKIARRPCSATSTAYEITRDGKKMLVKIDKDYAMIDLPKDKTRDQGSQAEDWKGSTCSSIGTPSGSRSISNAWRQMRDFFYAPNMNGVDWKAMRDKYAALLPFVNHRNDLTYLIGELIGELNNGHAYVGWRRTAGNAAHQAWLARRGAFARPGDARPIASIGFCPAKTGTRTHRSPLTDDRSST